MSMQYELDQEAEAMGCLIIAFLVSIGFLLGVVIMSLILSWLK